MGVAGLATLVTTACTALLGIGDLPEPPLGQDASPDVVGQPDVSAGGDAAADADASLDAGLTCDAGLTRCGGSCVDLTSDPLHCGACPNACATLDAGAAACSKSLCTLTVDEQAAKVWSTSAPGPWLAIWKDGTILCSGPASSVLIAPTSGAATAFVGGPDTQARPTIYLPAGGNLPDGGPRVETVLYHYGSFDAYRQDKSLAWSNGVHGCCGAGSFGFTVDPSLGFMYSAHALTQFLLDQGGIDTFYLQYVVPDSNIYVTSSWLYLPGPDGKVYKVSRSDYSNYQWVQPIGTGSNAESATNALLTSNEGIVTVSATGGLISRFDPNGSKPWEHAIVSPTAPILTSSGLIVLGEVVAEVPSLCARDVTTGSTKWCVTLADVVADALAGDDGVIYVAVKSKSEVYGYDAASGTLRYTFQNVPFPTEMLLRGGRIYAFGSGQVTAFDVPAKKYDASSWPVQHHDNQRTNGSVSTLGY